MNLNSKLATMFLIVVALGTIGTTATTAFAQSEEEILVQEETNRDVVVQNTAEEGNVEEDGENDVEEGAEDDGANEEEGAEEEPGIELDERQQAAIETADQFVHEAFEVEAGQEPPSEEDVLFHQALCQFGITTEALEELGGCEILPPLVESEDD
jgi:hypothetical protein